MVNKIGNSKRRVHQGGNCKYTKYSIRRSGRYNYRIEIKKEINEVAGKIIGK